MGFALIGWAQNFAADDTAYLFHFMILAAYQYNLRAIVIAANIPHFLLFCRFGAQSTKIDEKWCIRLKIGPPVRFWHSL